MGLFGAIKDRIIHRSDVDIGPEDMRSHVLGEPMAPDVDNEYIPTSRYAPPALSRMNTERTHNIGAPQGPEIVGRRAEDLMPADRMTNPMFSPAPPSFTPLSQEGPPTVSSANASNERILEKIDYLRQDIRSLKDNIELLSERVKNIQNRLEARRF